MQVVSKNEQPSSPSSTLSSPPITPKSSKDLMQIISKLLQQGQESAQHIRSFLIERLGLKVEDHQANIDHHSLVVLNSFKDALNILKSFDFDQEYVIRKRKIDQTNNIKSFDHCKAEDTCRRTITKDRRGCYKRRRTEQTWSMEATDLEDDGHAWRKYGQKDILNTNFPRNYYRCTHKHDQNCKATKQIQQISENPTKYNIIYIGVHTCNNLQKTSSIIIDPSEKISSFYLCFDSKNYPTVNIPTSINKEVPISTSMPHDLHHLSGTHSNMQCSSSSENLQASSDITSSTPISDQGDSLDYRLHDDDDELANFMTTMDHNDFYLDEIVKYPIN